MFEQLSLEGTLRITQRMRDRDRECLAAITPGMSDELFAINRWKTEGPAWQLVQNGVPVAMGGISMQCEWIGVAWFVATDEVSADSWKKLVRFSRTVFGNATQSIQRIEAYVLETWPESDKYARKLGFKQEGIKRCAGRDGQDIQVFSITQRREK